MFLLIKVLLSLMGCAICWGGVVAPLAGLSAASGDVDAVGTNARFNQPSGTAVFKNGIILVTDTKNINCGSSITIL
jgi:hypothetical protein